MVVPEDWKMEYIKSHITIGSGISPSAIKIKNDGMPYFKVEQLNNSTKYLTINETPYKVEAKKGIPKCSIIFAKRGAAIESNKIRILTVEALFDTNIMSITFIDEEFYIEYLYYWFVRNSLWNIADTTSVPQINNKHINPLRILTPPLSEQRAIATALSETDELITTLEKLIAKKCSVKQGTMQELLTGKQRLPGFSGEWKEKNIKSICKNITTGKLNANAMINNGRYRFYTCAKDYFYIDTYAFDTEALLISGNGENVGYIHYYNGKFNAYQRTYVLSDFSINIKWLKYYLDMFLQKRIENEVNLGNTPYIKLDTLTDMKINNPTLAEQTAIASILSDMDEEINTLTTKLNKLRNIKQGMMSELLNGRIRLIKDKNNAKN